MSNSLQEYFSEQFSDSDSLDSDSYSSDDCLDKEPEPVKDGYERIYSTCGMYYDRIIAKDGEERCGGCNRPYPPYNLQSDSGNSSIKYVCNSCLDKGKINRCKKCNNFIHNYKFLETFFGDQSYCNNCRPAIVFKFNLESGDFIEISIPIGKESGLATNYFYKELAKQLGVGENQMAIKGLWPNAMVCAAEFKPQHRIFNVMILKNNCLCGICDRCKYLAKEISYEYDENLRFSDWVWPAIN